MHKSYPQRQHQEHKSAVLHAQLRAAGTAAVCERFWLAEVPPSSSPMCFQEGDILPSPCVRIIDTARASGARHLCFGAGGASELQS